ncbi:hypothetical protein BDV96DRAFT_29519 [Lophiotrema nucula]|uniref:Uncharacterized protein n=1 Tax=Lophiotrema nucula TaxID=690887 RepID=A0A6A5ZC00_9PLEO|nr:hypothetical protein BDV96DRAFT_29519 [Lophiotrema nucula]
MVFSIPTALARTPFKTFAANYTSAYSAQILRAIVSDPSHPLCLARTRKEKQKERSGLWWHVTVNHNASSTKVVRTWITRRLRTAFNDELRLRGITYDGKLTRGKSGFTHRSALSRMMQEGKSLSLTGSIRLHCKPALVTAKYEEVRQETGKAVDILLRGLEADKMEKEVRSAQQTYTQKFPRPRGQRQMEEHD